jgi:hypothetical protein
MDRTLIWALVGIGTLAAVSIAYHDMADITDRRPLFSETKAVDEQQLRDKLESQGYSTVQISQDQGRLIATALKDGKKTRWVIDPKTGQDDSLFYDDDDCCRRARRRSRHEGESHAPGFSARAVGRCSFHGSGDDDDSRIEFRRRSADSL